MAQPTQLILETVVRGTDQARAQIQSLQSTVQQLGSALTAAGAGLTVGITVPLLALGANMVKLSADAEETKNKFDVIFGDMGKSVEEGVNKIADSMGRSRNIIRENVADLGDLLQSMGATREVSGQLGLSFIALSKDLGSLKNRSDEDAMNALKSAIVGISLPAKGLGLDLTQNAIKLYAFSLGIKENVENLNAAQRAVLVYGLAYKQSTNAIGDAERTQNSFANSLKHLQDNIHDIQLSIGDNIKEALRPMLTILVNLTEGWKNLSEPTKNFIVQVALVAASLGPVLLLLGLVTTTITVLSTEIGVMVVGVAGLAGVFVYLLATCKPLQDALTAVFDIVVEFGDKIAHFSEQSLTFQFAVITIAGALTLALIPAITSAIAALISFVSVAAVAAVNMLIAMAPFLIGGAIIAGLILLVTHWDEASKAIGEAGSGLVNTISNAVSAVGNFVTNTLGSLFTFVSDTVSGIVNFFTSLPGKVITTISNFIGSVVNWFAELPKKVRAGLDKGLPAIADWFLSLPGQILGWIAGIPSQLYNAGLGWAESIKNGLIGGVQEIGNTAKDLASRASNIASAIGGAVSSGVNGAGGFFSGLIDQAKKVKDDFVKTIFPDTAEMDKKTKELFDSVAKTAGAGGAGVSSALAAIPRDAMSISEPLFDQINKDYFDFFNRVSTYPQKLQNAFKGMYEAFVKTRGDISEVLKGMGDDFENNMNRIAGSIGEQNDKMQDLVDKFTETTDNNNKTLAKRFFDQANKINDLSEKIAAKQVEIAQNAAKMVTDQLKIEYENSLKILNDQKAVLDAQLTQAKNAADAFKNQTTEMDKQNQLLEERQNIQNNINNSILAINRAQRAVDNARPTDDIDELNARLQEAVYQKQLADQALVDSNAKAVRQAQQDVLDSAVRGIQDQQKQVTDSIQEFQDTNAAQQKERQRAEDAAAATALQNRLQQQLLDLQDAMDKEEQAYTRGLRREAELRSEIAAQARQLRKSEFTQFLDDWDAKQAKDQEAFQLTQRSIEDKVQLFAYQRDEEINAYASAKTEIARMEALALDVYNTSINQQVLATAAGTDLMKQYFDKVTSSVQNLGRNINEVNNIKYRGQSIDPFADKQQLPSLNNAPSGQYNTYITNIDTMVGTKEFATQVGNQIAKNQGLNQAI